MRTFNIRVIELDDRDVRLSATNGGLAVELSPETQRVIIKAASGEAEKSDKVPAAGTRG